MSAIATIIEADDKLIAAVRDCFPSDSITAFTGTSLDLLVDPYGDRTVRIEARPGEAEPSVQVSLIHPSLGLICSISRAYAGDNASTQLTGDVFKFLKGVFNYAWM